MRACVDGRYDVWWLLDLSKGQVWEYPHQILHGDADDKPVLLWGVQGGGARARLTVT